MQQALQREGLVRLAPVENIPGAAGTIGLARFIGAERGRGDTLMVSGLIMLGGNEREQLDVNALHLARGVARQAGQAILNARHREEEQARSRHSRQFVRF